MVEGADEIRVIGTRKAKDQVIVTDPTPFGHLKIELDKLPVIVLGSSDTLAISAVLAVATFGVSQTVTSGMVSALGRNQLGINTFSFASDRCGHRSRPTPAALWWTSTGSGHQHRDLLPIEGSPGIGLPFPCPPTEGTGRH
jgi:hypothetical protein